MNILTIVLRVLDSFPMQNLVAMHILCASLKKRRTYVLRVLMHALPMLMSWTVSQQVHPGSLIANPFLDRLLMTMPLLYTFFGVIFCYQSDLTESVFCFSCAAIIENFNINLWYVIKMHAGFEEGSFCSLSVSMGMLLLFCIPFFLAVTKRIDNIKWTPSVKKQIVANTFLFLVFQTFFNNRVPGAPWEEAVYVTYMIADLSLLVIQFVLSRESVLQQKYEMIEELLRSEQKKQQMTAENVELINRKCHDLKHQISGLKRMQNDAERDSYIKEIESAVMFYESSIKTGCETLDLIMMDKLLYCQAHDIKLTCISDGEKLKKLETMDIYTLFGNALDNALESVTKEPDPSLRVISMRIGSWGDYLTIHIENYVSKEPELSGSLPRTTKADKQYHGFGLLSIRHTVEKYKGKMNIRTDKHLFCLDILIPAA